MRTTRELGTGSHRVTLARGVRACRVIPTHVRHVLVLSVLLPLLAPAPASQVEIDVTHTYPFSTGRAVVAEKTGSNPAEIYSGHGSGVHVLETVHPEPSLQNSGVATGLLPGGLVRDLALTGDHLYVAALRGGLVRHQRSSTDNEPEWILDTQDLDATQPWAVAVATNVDDTDLVFVGTNDDYYAIDDVAGGSLHLVWAETGTTPAAPEVQDSIDIGFPVYSF
jgi:hypothetical protein